MSEISQHSRVKAEDSLHARTNVYSFVYTPTGKGLALVKLRNNVLCSVNFPDCVEVSFVGVTNVACVSYGSSGHATYLSLYAFVNVLQGKCMSRTGEKTKQKTLFFVCSHLKPPMRESGLQPCA